jgi:hypothetical protein
MNCEIFWIFLIPLVILTIVSIGKAGGRRVIRPEKPDRLPPGSCPPPPP